MIFPFISAFLLSCTTAGLSSCTQVQEPYETVLFATDPADTTREVACYRIPAITTAPNGDLLAVIDQRVPSCGDLKWNRDINIALRRSTDGGYTWSEEQVIVDYPLGQSASDPSLITDTGNGDIYLFYNFMDHNVATDVYFLHMMKSSDNGKTWSEPRDLTPEIVPEGWENDWMFITSGRGIVTRDGRILHTLVNLEHGLHIIGSDDRGDTWYMLPPAIRPSDEAKIIELADGSWMVNSRVHGEGCRWLHTSTDGGQTWKSNACTALPDPSCNATTLTYKYKGTEYILFANAADSEHRRCLTIRYSADSGRTWSPGKVLYPGSAAYSSMTVNSDGDIVIFYECDDYTTNKIAILSPEWLFE